MAIKREYCRYKISGLFQVDQMEWNPSYTPNEPPLFQAMPFPSVYQFMAHQIAFALAAALTGHTRAAGRNPVV
jgi:hypothetical protein